MAFESVGALHPHRSGFDLSYSKTFSCDMGQLIPVMCDEVVPGDVFKISADWLIRANPMVAPIMSQVDASVHYFFVPYRLLWTDWENFITGGRDGDFESEIPYISGYSRRNSLLDYLGFPVGDNDSVRFGGDAPGNIKPNVFPLLAYNFVWNEYYRDENFQAYQKYYVDTHFDGMLTDDDKFLSRYGCVNTIYFPLDNASVPRGQILYRNWQKDYFTSSTFARQRGPAVALPVSGILPVTFNNDWQAPVKAKLGSLSQQVYAQGTSTQGSFSAPIRYETTGGGTFTSSDYPRFFADRPTGTATVNLNQALTFNVSDLRLATQIQKWQERNMRAGIRYTEFLRAHFGVSPSDSRLDRPEYIGMAKSPVIVSEVLQTGSTDATSPQGNMAGHGIGVNQQRIGTYRAQEFGLIIGMFSIMPKPTYASQGVNRQWLRQTNKDYYFPEFANLSEQAVYNCEIYYTGDSAVDPYRTFGYQGAYDEMRTKNDMVVGLMRPELQGGFGYWTLARTFAQQPLLNEEFIKCTPRKDFLAVPSEPAFIVSFGNSIHAYRPMPEIAEPGLMDHH